MMRSVLVCSLLAALSSTATGFSFSAPLPLRRGGIATGVTTRAPAVAVRRAPAAELRCSLSIDPSTPCELEASDLKDFTTTLTRSKVVFVKMYQGRCRQCIALAPKFKSLALEHSRTGEVVFMKVAADKLREIAQHAGITRAPTIQAYVDGVLFMQIVSPLPNSLSQLAEVVGVPASTESGVLPSARPPHPLCVCPSSATNLDTCQGARSAF